jgi:hypothetical protein
LLPGPVVDEIDRVYGQFATYGCPRNLWVCPQCGPEWSAAQICSAPLRSVSLPQLTAVHIMSLDDDGLRYFIPRLVELLLVEPSPWFDFRLSELKGRLPAWQPDEYAALRQLVNVVWRELLHTYPAALGYFSDTPSTLSFIDSCDIPLARFLDEWENLHGLAAVRHLADLVEYLLYNAQPVPQAPILSWLRRQTIGNRLQDAFFAADSDDDARRLSAAYELWTVFVRA